MAREWFDYDGQLPWLMNKKLIFSWYPSDRTLSGGQILPFLWPQTTALRIKQPGYPGPLHKRVMHGP